MKKILFADNDPDFLATRAEYLERAGFHVYKASTLREAEHYLRNAWVHLAILDIRMMDDDDEKDVSGMTLIDADFAHKITKIVLTSFNTPLVRELVRVAQKAQSLALDVIEKAEGPGQLIAAVHDAFAKHIHINWDLSIEWRERDAISLIRLIDPALEGEELLSRAQELEDLFRRLFYEDDHIRVERMLWKGEGRVALIVFAFREERNPGSYVVVCGRSPILQEEVKRFEQFAPTAPGDTGTRLTLRNETTHYAANAYTFARIELEKTQSLQDFYRNVAPNIFHETLTRLFQKTLAEWHQDKSVVQKKNSLETLYRQRLELHEEDFSEADFEDRVQAIVSQLPTLGSKMTRTDKVLTVQFKDQSFSYPDPLLFFSETAKREDDVVAICVPGLLSGENILADEIEKNAWLTDFAQAGLAPLYWNYVSLEAAIRFDWTTRDTKDNLLTRFELENCLLSPEFDNLHPNSLSPILQKRARAMETIRRLVIQIVGKDVMDYHHGIFLHGARRLADFNPANRVTPAELTRLGHILLSMAMIAGKLVDSKSNGLSVLSPKQTDPLTLIDEKARIVLIGERELHLTQQEFEVFHHLYLHINEVCTNEELLSIALKGNYSDDNLYTLISRIRRKIEPDPKYPRYLINEANAGYRLISQPE